MAECLTPNQAVGVRLFPPALPTTYYQIPFLVVGILTKKPKVFFVSRVHCKDHGAPHGSIAHDGLSGRLISERAKVQLLLLPLVKEKTEKPFSPSVSIEIHSS